MKTIRKTSIRLVAIVATTMGLVCAAVAEDSATAGFLDPDIEARLEQVKLDDGREALRWISPELTGANYKAMMVDRVVFYPAPNPGPQVSSSSLENISDYATEALRRHLADSIQIVDEAGPGVLRMQPAITAVVVKQEGLSAKDIVPIHLLFSAAKSATGKMDENVKANFEVRITDSMSTDYRAAVKLTLKGEKLKGEKDQLTVDDFKKHLDDRAAAGAKVLKQVLTR